MKILYTSLVCLLFSTQCFASTLRAKNNESPLKYSTSFSTSRDFAASLSTANIKLKNTGSSSAVVYGLYIRQFSYVAAGQSCSSATSIYAASTNKAAGAMVMPVTIPANNEAGIGGNYLYNMIYNAIYYVQIVFSSSPPGCALPGCTWGADTTTYHWCIHIGAMAPVSVTSGYTSKVAPSTTAVSAGGYNYNLISTYETIGPISCDDQKLTCSVDTPQMQSF